MLLEITVQVAKSLLFIEGRNDGIFWINWTKYSDAIMAVLVIFTCKPIIILAQIQTFGFRTIASTFWT